MAEFHDVDLPAARLMCVQFPGYVANIGRVLQTLGGERAVEQAVRAGRPIELRFRPGSSAAHPIRTAGESTNGVLLKITRKKNSFNAGAENGSAIERVEAIGVIRSTYNINGQLPARPGASPSQDCVTFSIKCRSPLSRRVIRKTVGSSKWGLLTA